MRMVFYGSQLRFFKILTLFSKLKKTVETVREYLKNDYQVVVTVMSTGEASLKRMDSQQKQQSQDQKPQQQQPSQSRKRRRSQLPHRAEAAPRRVVPDESKKRNSDHEGDDEEEESGDEEGDGHKNNVGEYDVSYAGNAGEADDGNDSKSDDACGFDDFDEDVGLKHVSSLRDAICMAIDHMLSFLSASHTSPEHSTNERLLMQLKLEVQAYHWPPFAPIDMLVDSLGGHQNVIEMTGRKTALVRCNVSKQWKRQAINSPALAVLCKVRQ
jgi:hypothetical protein